MSTKYLFTADPLLSFKPEFDTTLLLMRELLLRGIDVDFCDLNDLNIQAATSDYLSALQVAKVSFSNPKQIPFAGLETKRTASVGEYDVIFHRKDPPVDEFYRAHAGHFAKAPAKILQINNPAETPFHSEHELPIRFPDYAIPTTVCESLASFVRAVREQKIEAVAKPMNECSGNGVEFFLPDTAEVKLEVYWKRWSPSVIVQPYLDEITKSGDLRILVMNQKIMGSVLRVPRSGSRLANLHKGATGRAFSPTTRQLEACAAVARELTPKGLYLLGLDFIGDQLSEINITSPSAVGQINDVMKIDITPKLIDECEILRTQKIKETK